MIYIFNFKYFADVENCESFRGFSIYIVIGQECIDPFGKFIN